MEQTSLTIEQKETIKSEYQFFQNLPNVLEIPADVVLYQILQISKFCGIVTIQDILKYHNILSDIYGQYRDQLAPQFALNYPSGGNYHKELFEEVSIDDEKIGFRLRSVKGKTAENLREYRLSRIRIFSKQQGEIFEKFINEANEIFKKYKEKRNNSSPKDENEIQKKLSFLRMIQMRKIWYK